VSAQSQPAHGLRPASMSSSSLPDRLYRWRDALIGNPLFQRLSASFPLTRGIATKEARALFDLCAGFVYSQVLSACVDLDICGRVRDEPKALPQLARETGVPAERLERLLLAAVSLRLLSRRRHERYGLGMLGAALVADKGIAAMVAHHKMLYRDLADPVALLRGEAGETELSKFWRYAASPDAAALNGEAVADYSALMAASQSFIADDVLDAYPFDRHTCLMDVGGGEGAFLLAATARYPKLRVQLFDLPAVAERAQVRFDQAGIADRATAAGGSFIHDALPQGADLISLVRVVHDHDDDVVRTLLRRVYAALPPGGTVVIAEPMAGVSGAEPIGDAYFGFYLMAMGSGRARAPADLVEMLCEAGFRDAAIRATRRPMMVGMVAAKK
jgi:demethylspheroidene O-methyltransferase